MKSPMVLDFFSILFAILMKFLDLAILQTRLTFGFNNYNSQLSCNPFPRTGPRRSPCSSGHLRRKQDKVF